MKWVIHFDTPNRVVMVKVSGIMNAAPLREMTAELRDAVLEHQSKEVLLDYTETLSGLEPYEIFERPRVLQELSFPADVKVAVLFLALNEDTQFLENVYRNKSFPVRVFSDRNLALSWLSSAPPN